MKDLFKTVELPFDEDIYEYIKKKGYRELVVLSKSLDARNAIRGRVPKYVYRLGPPPLEESFKNLSSKNYQPIIVGMGPSGLFSALRYLEYGIIPILFEQGENIDQRSKDVALFFKGGVLNESSNICHGLGGAGLFSDGKLNTRIKSDYLYYFKKKLVEFGAPKDIVCESSPHLGTDRMRKILGNIYSFLISKGVVVNLNHKVEEVLISEKAVIGIVANGKKFYGDSVILAIGQTSSLWDYLFRLNLPFAFKEFAVGFRVEHSRTLIDGHQHGKFATKLPPATYKLTYNNNLAGIYSFCMCPGGTILNASSQTKRLVINGMSNSKRNGPFSNSGIVRTVKDSELSGDSFKGLRFVEKIEQHAYLEKNLIPGQKIDDFIEGRTGSIEENSVVTNAVVKDLNDIYPSCITNDLKQGLLNFCRKIKGFSNGQLFAPETRTSSTFKINVENQEIKNLFFIGEGAGRAGGITSSAISGIEQVNAILEQEFF